LVVLQNPTDSENVRGLCTEICPKSSHNTYQAINIKAEVLSDVEEEEDPLAKTFPGGIKAEPEVSHDNEAVYFIASAVRKEM
jgi:hypothetical protein